MIVASQLMPVLRVLYNWYPLLHSDFYPLLSTSSITFKCMLLSFLSCQLIFIQGPNSWGRFYALEFNWVSCWVFVARFGQQGGEAAGVSSAGRGQRQPCNGPTTHRAGLISQAATSVEMQKKKKKNQTDKGVGNKKNEEQQRGKRCSRCRQVFPLQHVENPCLDSRRNAASAEPTFAMQLFLCRSCRLWRACAGGSSLQDCSLWGSHAGVG